MNAPGKDVSLDAELRRLTRIGRAGFLPSSRMFALVRIPDAFSSAAPGGQDPR